MPGSEATSFAFEALERAADRVSSWVQFGDAKAAGVLVLLGLGLTDLLNHAAGLLHAHRLPSAWGDVATVALWAAFALAVVTVVETSRALFPRVKATRDSVFFFGTIAQYRSGAEYAAAFREMPKEKATEHLAEQVWELSRIASQKFARARMSYWLVLAFLTAWAVGRTALALAT